MNAKQLYKEILAGMSAFLRPRGFRGSGPNFKRVLPDLAWLIAVQKSDSCTAERLKFTVNIGIWSKDVSVLSGKGDVAPNAMRHCHTDARIADFQPGMHDIWWTLYEESDLVACLSQLIGLLEGRVLPELERLTTAELLMQEWTDGKSYLRPMYDIDARFKTLLRTAVDNRRASEAG